MRQACVENAVQVIRAIANEILRLASAFFAQAELDRRLKSQKISWISIAKPKGASQFSKFFRLPRPGIDALPHASPSPNCTVHAAKADDTLMPYIQHVWQTHMQVYGADKVWHQMSREGIKVARCTVAPLHR